MRQLLSAHIVEDDRVEHVVVHPGARPCPVVGFYVLSGCLPNAEEQVGRLCRRVLAQASELHGWALVDAQVPLAPLPWQQHLAFPSPPQQP